MIIYATLFWTKSLVERLGLALGVFIVYQVWRVNVCIDRDEVALHCSIIL